MKRSVLVVDDEKPIRQLLERALGQAGYAVRCAASAEEALEILAGESIPVLLLDLQLPKMDGLELCRQIRKDKPVDCIYALTGYASVYDLVQCREAGFDDYFTKPFDLAVLVKTVGDAFDRLDRWKGQFRKSARPGAET